MTKRLKLLLLCAAAFLCACAPTAVRSPESTRWFQTHFPTKEEAESMLSRSTLKNKEVQP